MDIAHVFKPYEQAVEISLQMPEDWNYILWDVEEESPDWGYSVKVQGREDAIFSMVIVNNCIGVALKYY